MKFSLRATILFVSFYTTSVIGVAENVPATDTLHFQSGKQQTHLLELFTSQGCSSCPPAERWLNKWADDDRLWDDIVPVAFHVDYWDYLGWQDPYASKVFSARQRNYYRKGNIKSVYTPGFVVSGREWRGYHKHYAIPERKPSTHSLFARLADGKLDVNIRVENGKPSTHFVFHAAILGIGIKTQVTRGENSHRVLPQDFVALKYTESRSKNGKWRWQLPEYKTTDAQRYGIAVWVSDHRTGDVIQSSGSWL